MEDDTIFVEYIPFVRLLPCLAIRITSLLAINLSLLKPSVFEEESDSSDEDPDKVPHKASDQEGPDELGPDEVDPTQEAPEEVDPNRFNSQKFDLNAVVMLATTIFTSKTSSLEARSLRCSRASKLGGPDAALNERTVAVLDALAYVSVNKSSSLAVAISLTMKPLQLVVSTNNKVPSTSILEHLDTICSTLQNISDAKFGTCSDPNSQSNADLREVSPAPDFFDENLESHYNNLFLQIYKYSHDRFQLKNKKRLEVIDGFRNQLTDWKNKVTREQGNRSDLNEPHKTFFDTFNDFCLSGFSLRDCLDQFSQSSWKIDADKMHKLKSHWNQMLACAKDILGQEVGGKSICDHWAIREFPAGQRPNKKEKPLQLRRAIEKLVSFHCHVFTLIRFANSKRMRSHFSSKIKVISAEKTHSSALSWPSNKREWGDLLGSIYNKHGLTRKSGLDVIKTEQKMKSRAEKCGVAAIIHCECAMIAYLYKYPAFQTFSYIDTSKLCCKACHYWMEALNRTMSTNFRTRCSHNKWYEGWARPGLGKAANQNQGKVDAVFLAFGRKSYASTKLASEWQGWVVPLTAQIQMSLWHQCINSHMKWNLRRRVWESSDGFFDSRLEDQCHW